MYEEVIHLKKSWWINNDKGYFATALALTTAYPVGQAGWFAVVWTTDTVWVWDTWTNTWLDTGTTSTSFLKIDQTTPQTTVGTFTFPKIKLTTGATNWYVLTSDADGLASWAVGSSGSGGHTIQDEGTSLIARANLNFVGAGVTVTDGGAGTNDTIVTIPGENDEKVKYNAADPTAGYIANKIVAGTGISVAEGTGSNENKLVVTNSNPTPYTLPVATASVLGGVKKGNRISIDANGVISADVQASGDVVGPASAVNSGVALFDGITGKIIKDGWVLGSAAFANTWDFASSSVTQYTDEMAQDAIGSVVGNGLDYDDATGAISVDESELSLPFLKLDQTTPQTTVWTFTFPRIKLTTGATNWYVLTSDANGLASWAAGGGGGGGDMLLGTAQTVTAAKTFDTGTLISPTLTGGTAVGSNIIYKSTTGAGTTAGIAHQWTGGNNGATVIGTMLNNGNVGIGTEIPLAILDIPLQSTTVSALRAGGTEFQTASTDNAWFTSNIYYNNGFKYRNNGYGTLFYMFQGDFEVRTAASGTAGDTANAVQRFIVTQPGDVGIGGNQTPGEITGSTMVVLNSGNVGIGTKTPTYLLSLGGNAVRTIGMERNTTTNTAGRALSINAGGATSAANNKDGGMITLSPGLSTGTGKSSVRNQRLSRATSTGSTDNTLSDATIIPSIFNLTNSSANGLFTIALPTLNSAGGSIDFTIHVGNGTDIQKYTGRVDFASVNKGGVYTSSIVEVTATSAVSAGTLNTAWTITTGTDIITINVTPTSSLTPTSHYIEYTIPNVGAGANAITQL